METRTLWAEIKDAVTPRTFGLVVGVLLLQLGFILSYVGAFHSPTPRDIKVAVVGPAQQAHVLAQKLNAVGGHPLSVRASESEAQVRRSIERGELSGALVVNLAGTTDQVLVAGGGGSSVVTAVEQVLTSADAAQHRTVEVVDVVPLQKGDNRGLSGFYLVIGWLVGGYLVASLLGVAAGARPASLRRAIVRLGALAVYAIASGLGGALIVGPVLGALTGHFVALWWLGALVVFAAGAATVALQTLLGILGIGAAVLLFVVLGNPSAGGAYQLNLLPPFWRHIGYLLPNGAGTDSVRRIVYFGANGIGGHLLVLALWAVLGTAVALTASHLLPRDHPEPEPITAEAGPE